MDHDVLTDPAGPGAIRISLISKLLFLLVRDSFRAEEWIDNRNEPKSAIWGGGQIDDWENE